MTGRHCLLSPASALARVFLSAPAPPRLCHGALSVPPFLAPFTVPATRRCAHHGPLGPGRSLMQRMPMAGMGMRMSGRPGGRPGHGHGQGQGYGADQAKFKLGRLPRDDEITHRYVIMRLSDGTLSEPRLTKEVLARINRVTESLVVLAMPPTKEEREKQEQEEEEEEEEEQEQAQEGHEGQEGLEDQEAPVKVVPRYPICRVVNRVAERKAEADRARELRRKAVRNKELELNWAIDPHDLTHRMAKLQEFLERGLRVEVSLFRKGKGKGRRQATQDEAAEVVRRVRETVATVPGAREAKAMEGELLRTVKLVFDGPAAAKNK